MTEIIVAQISGLAAQWRGEAATFENRGAADSARLLRSIADELDATLKAAAEDTKPLTVKQYARDRGVEPATVRKWIRGGLLVAQKADGGEWRIPRAARPKRPRTVSR